MWRANMRWKGDKEQALDSRRGPERVNVVDPALQIRACLHELPIPKGKNKADTLLAFPYTSGTPEESSM